LGGHIAISSCASSLKFLSLKPPWSILSGSQLKRNKLVVFISKCLGLFLPQAHQVCVKKHNTRVKQSCFITDLTRKYAVDYYTTAHRRSDTDVAYGGATWRVKSVGVAERFP